MSTNNQSVLFNFAVIRFLPFLNNPKDLDPSYKMDLDFWDCFGRKKTPSYTYSAQKESRFPAGRISLHRNGVYERRQSKDIVRWRQESL